MKKIISTLLLIAIFVTAFSVSSFAANTEDVKYQFVVTPTESSMTDPLSKEDDSAVYTKVTYLEYGSNCKVSVYGGNSKQTLSPGWVNYTYSKGLPTDFVTLNKNINYSVHNYVNESGKPYARLGVKGNTAYTYEHVVGWWSPDSKYAWEDAYT